MHPAVHQPDLSLFSDRRRPPAFWLGTLLVVSGVLLHIPMFVMARSMHYRSAGMPMGAGMLTGMGSIIAGTAAVLYGLRPKEASIEAAITHERIVAPEDAPLTVWHWAAGAALAIVVDTMKISSLGFVIPGMRVEYGISPAGVALLPLSALSGATLGSFIWGAQGRAARHGRHLRSRPHRRGAPSGRRTRRNRSGHLR